MDAPIAKTPLILAEKVIFGKLFPIPKLCKTFVAHVNL